MSLDRDQLREALNVWDAERDLDDSVIDITPIVEAARLVVEGREVWWCEPHASVQAAGREHCQAWYLPDTDVEQGCRMVRMILIDGSET